MATTSQVSSPTDGTTPAATLPTDSGTPDSAQSPSPPGSTAIGSDASPADPGGGASDDSGTDGSGNTVLLVTTGSTGTSTTTTDPPVGDSTDSSDTPAASDNPPSSNTQDAQGNATANQSGAQNGNLLVQVGQSGDTGTVNQGNQAGSSASSSSTGSLPQDGSDPSATATANTNQDSPGNTNVTVLVGSQGDVGSVGQQNTAQADAAAQGTTDASGTGGGGQANANATQTSPSNVNVVVRVGSPGDNGTVTQQNNVVASAGPNSTTTPFDTTDTTGPAATDQLVTTSNTQSDVTNAGDVEQQLIQTQDGPGPDVTADAGDALALPTTSVGSALATQTGALNLNVSIRIGSPGSDGSVVQTNGATSTGTSPELAIVNVTDGSNVNLSIVLPGSADSAPGDNWMWNWLWTGDGTPPSGATADSAAPTTGSTWNWSWTTSSATTPTTTPTPTPGTFTWTWTWTLPNGQVTTVTQQQACDCNWQWNWTWDWSTGLPTSTSVDPTTASSGAAPAPGDAPSLTLDNGPVDQSNTVQATATASTDVPVTPLLAVDQSGVDPALEMQDAEPGQSFANTQSATATAQADQIDPSNMNSVWGRGIPVASVTQANTVTASSDAETAAVLDQELIQGQDGTPDTYQWLGAQQTAVNTQVVSAGTQATQTGAANTNIVSAPDPNQAAVGAIAQVNSATSTATVLALAALTQQLAQFEDAIGSGLEMIDLTQLLTNSQTADVTATAAQTLTQNLDNLVVPAASRATNPALRQRNIASVVASSGNYGYESSIAFQYQGGAVDIENTSALQQITVTQSGTSSAPVSQNQLLNQAGWLGVEPPPPTVPGGGDQGGGGGDSTGAGGGTTASTTIVASTTIGGSYVAFSKRAPAPGHHVHPTTTTTKSSGSQPTSAPFAPPSFGWSPGAAPTSAGAQPASGPTGLSPPPAQVTQYAPWSTPCSDCSGAGKSTTGSDKSRHGGAGVAAAVQTDGPWSPVPSSPNSAGSATSGSAPSTGSGQIVIAFGPYKLVAPQVLGPQMPAPILGRSVVFLDPFERPG